MSTTRTFLFAYGCEEYEMSSIDHNLLRLLVDDQHHQFVKSVSK